MRDLPPLEPDKRGRVLARLAALLGCSTNAFLTGEEAPAELAQSDELMRLWCTLRTDDERQRALASVRAIVGDGS
jgi:hypothetical protein